MKFQTGKIIATHGVAAHMNENEPFRVYVTECISRHMNCDYGNIDEHDKGMNERAIKNGSRLMSVYPIKNGMIKTYNDDIWIITDAKGEDGKRLSTTVLFPDEY